MRIHYVDNYEELSREAAEIVLNALKQKPGLLLCAATGHSPTGLYRELAKVYKKDQHLFDHFRIIKLDEWGGIDGDNPASCEYYLRQHVVGPLRITEDRYLGFMNNPPEPVTECLRVQEQLTREGPVDICVLGLGANGHMGLNEPAKELQPHCHVAQLTETTLSHGMIAGSSQKPTYGMTIGVEDILASRHVLMLVVGAGKEEAREKLLSGEVTNELPATHLWRHNNVDCIVVR